MARGSEKMPVNPPLGERIRLYRRRRGMEQKALGALIGVSQNTVNNWERGRACPGAACVPRLCEVLGISLPELFGLEEGTEEERELLRRYRALDAGHRRAVDALTAALLEAQEEAPGRKIVSLPLYPRALAAGLGDPSELEEGGMEPFYLYDSDALRGADWVFRVNGDSMEPAFPDGAHVLIQRVGAADTLRMGEIGAFMVENELYIKQYERDGLHSLNPAWPVMRFQEETQVFLIGRVLRALRPEECASERDVRAWQAREEGGIQAWSASM